MRVVLFSTVIVLLFPTGAFAMDHGVMHEGNHAAGHEMMHDSNEAAPTPGAVPEAESPAGQDPRLREIEAHMEKLDFLLDEIADAETPVARRSLMRDHVAEMQGVVKAMQRLMWCCPPGEPVAGEGHERHAMGMDHAGDMHHGGQKMAHQLDAIFQRVKIMQQLMGQIVEQQSFLLDEMTTGPAH